MNIIAASNLRGKTSEEIPLELAKLSKESAVLSVNYDHLAKTDDYQTFLPLLPGMIHTLLLEGHALGFRSKTEVKAIFASLPSNIKHLRLPINDLDNFFAFNLAACVAALPATLTQLDLSINGLDSSPDLGSLLAALPQTLSMLDLSINGLLRKDADFLKYLFTAIPASLHELHLGGGGYRLQDAKRRQVAAALPLLPPTLKHLGLSGLQLFNKKHPQRTTDLLKALPETLTVLDLSNNIFEFFAPTDLPTHFAALPRGLVHLSLKKNALFKQNINILIAALNKLPPELKFLDLSNNKLAELPKKNWVDVFAALPPKLTHLDLSDSYWRDYALLAELPNNVSQLSLHGISTGPLPNFIMLKPTLTHLDLQDNRSLFSVANVAHILESIPVTVTHLDLGNNALFNNRTSLQIELIMQAFPESLTTLGFSNNSLYKNSVKQLKTFFKELPPSLTHLDLRHNFLLEGKTAAELKQIFAMLPTSVTRIDLAGNGLDTLSPEELSAVLASLPKTISIIDLGDNHRSSQRSPEAQNELRGLLSISCPSCRIFGNGDDAKHALGSLKESRLPTEISNIILDYLEEDPAKIVSPLIKAEALTTARRRIDQELKRLEGSKGGILNIWKMLNLQETSDSKIRAFTDLKLLLASGPRRKDLDEWKKVYTPCILRQRNHLHTFFSPNHKTHSETAMEEIFAGLLPT